MWGCHRSVRWEKSEVEWGGVARLRSGTVKEDFVRSVRASVVGLDRVLIPR